MIAGQIILVVFGLSLVLNGFLVAVILIQRSVVSTMMKVKPAAGAVCLQNLPRTRPGVEIENNVLTHFYETVRRELLEREAKTGFFDEARAWENIRKAASNITGGQYQAERKHDVGF